MSSMRGRVRVCLGAALLAMAVPLAGSPIQSASRQPVQDPRSERQILERATELHQAGDFAGAVREYQAFLKRRPDVADVRSNLGAAYVRLGQHEQAIEQYRRALALGNAADPVAVRFNLALAYYKAARLDEAAAELARVLTARPDQQSALLLLATCQLSAGEYKKAIDLLSPYEAKLGRDRAFAYLLGTALLKSGDLERGQALIDLILRQGDSAEARFMLGTAQLQRGDAVAAVAEFERALQLNQELPLVNALLGRSLSEMSRPDEAAEAFRRELRLNPNDFDSNLQLGIHLQKAEQDYAAALTHYQRALRIRPGSPEARYQIGLVYLMTERPAEALKMIEGVVKDVPDFLEGHATLTRLYYRLGRREDAERHRAIADELRARRDAEGLAVARQPSRQ